MEKSKAQELYKLLVESGVDKATLKRAREELLLDRKSYARKLECKLCGHREVFKTWLRDTPKGRENDNSIPTHFSYEEAGIRDRDTRSTCPFCITWAMQEADSERLREALLKVLNSVAYQRSIINI